MYISSVTDFLRKLNDFTVILNRINYFYNVLMSRNSHKYKHKFTRAISFYYCLCHNIQALKYNEIMKIVNYNK